MQQFIQGRCTVEFIHQYCAEITCYFGLKIKETMRDEFLAVPLSVKKHEKDGTISRIFGKQQTSLIRKSGERDGKYLHASLRFCLKSAKILSNKTNHNLFLLSKPDLITSVIKT